MTRSTNFFVGPDRQRPMRSLDQYVAALEELEQLRDLWVTLRDFAPNTRHARAAKARTKRRAAQLQDLIDSIQQPPAPPGD